METVVITSEAEIKKWMREVMREELAAFVLQLQGGEPAYEEPLLTREEIAQYLHISMPTLRHWVRRGLPCIRKGRRQLFLKSAVLEAIKERPAKNGNKPSTGRVG